MKTEDVLQVAFIVACVAIIGVRACVYFTPVPPMSSQPSIHIPTPLVPWGSIAPGPRPPTVRGAPFVDCCELAEGKLTKGDWICVEGVVIRCLEGMGAMVVVISCQHCDDGIVSCDLRSIAVGVAEGSNVVLYGRVSDSGLPSLGQVEFIAPEELQQELEASSVD